MGTISQVGAFQSIYSEICWPGNLSLLRIYEMGSPPFNASLLIFQFFIPRRILIVLLIIILSSILRSSNQQIKKGRTISIIRNIHSLILATEQWQRTWKWKKNWQFRFFKTNSKQIHGFRWHKCSMILEVEQSCIKRKDTLLSQ